MEHLDKEHISTSMAKLNRAAVVGMLVVEPFREMLSPVSWEVVSEAGADNRGAVGGLEMRHMLGSLH